MKEAVEILDEALKALDSMSSEDLKRRTRDSKVEFPDEVCYNATGRIEKAPR